MPFNNNITPGAPPLLWSDVNDAFTRINENFDIIVATVGGGSGLTPIDFTSLDTSVKPTIDNLQDLGDITHRWKGVFAGEYTDADLLNGVWTGTAQIKGVAGTVNLPAGSTVGGNPLTGVGSSLIIDPDKTFFKSVQVDNANSVEATTFGDTLNLISGSGVSKLVSSGADSITISNTGLLAVTSGSGITVATVSGTTTVTNAGVRSLQSTTALPVGRATGAGINITAGTGDNLRITNTGVIDVQAGSGALAVSTDIVTGIVTITNTSPAQPAFQQIEVNGDSGNRLIADSTAGVFRVVSGQGITLDKNPATDTVTITIDPVFDLKGSVFADDSTLLIDGVDGKIVGDVETSRLRTTDPTIALGIAAGETNQGVNTIAIGAAAGQANQGTSSIAIGGQAGATGQAVSAVAVGTQAGATNQGAITVALGTLAGTTNQGLGAVAVGGTAGSNTQGNYAVALGYLAGANSQPANSIVINASGSGLNGSAAGFYVDPIRNQSGTGNILQYNISTKEITYSSGIDGDITGSVFADDSTLLVDGVGGQIVGPINSFDGVNSITMDTINGVIIGGTSGAQIIGAAGAQVYIGGGTSGSTSGNILLGNGTNRVLFVSNTIDTDDSSALIFEPPVTFNTDVTFENDLTVAERLTVKGSRVINLTELKSVVAASASFADFQTRIAALV